MQKQFYKNFRDKLDFLVTFFNTFKRQSFSGDRNNLTYKLKCQWDEPGNNSF